MEREALDLLLYSLTHCLRIVPLSFAPTMIRRAERLGLVEKRAIFARPPLTLTEPLATIGPKDKLLQGWEHKLQWSAEKRLEEPEQYYVFFASRKAANIYGGEVPKFTDLQAGHDILLAQVFSTYMLRGLNPQTWFGEDSLKGFEKLTKIPDALILGVPPKAIEILGFYSSDRIRLFRESFRDGLLTVEFW